jgi:hypothetical protein
MAKPGKLRPVTDGIGMETTFGDELWAGGCAKGRACRRPTLQNPRHFPLFLSGFTSHPGHPRAPLSQENVPATRLSCEERRGWQWLPAVVSAQPEPGTEIA